METMDIDTNTVPIDHCKFVTCPECGGLGYYKAPDYDPWSPCIDYCELCGGMGEYLELDYVEDGYEVIEDE